MWYHCSDSAVNQSIYRHERTADRTNAAAWHIADTAFTCGPHCFLAKICQDMPRCILIAASVLDHGMLDDSPIRISNTELFIDGRVIFCARLDATSASDYQPESFPFTAQGLWSSFTVVGYPKKGTPKRIDPILNLSSRGVVLE